MAGRELLDRLLGHDAWTTRRVLELARGLSDAELDRELDIGHRTLRATAHHLIGNIETWTDLMAGRPVRRLPRSGQSLAALQQRFEAAAEDFARVARALSDAGRLDERYVDVLDDPPREKSYGGTILHVLTHDHLHRSEMLHMLARLGVPDLPEGDVLGWEATAG